MNTDSVKKVKMLANSLARSIKRNQGARQQAYEREIFTALTGKRKLPND